MRSFLASFLLCSLLAFTSPSTCFTAEPSLDPDSPQDKPILRQTLGHWQEFDAISGESASGKLKFQIKPWTPPQKFPRDVYPAEYIVSSQDDKVLWHFTIATCSSKPAFQLLSDSGDLISILTDSDVLIVNSRGDLIRKVNLIDKVLTNEERKIHIRREQLFVCGNFLDENVVLDPADVPHIPEWISANWGEDWIGYLVGSADGLCFSIRTSWDRRIVFSLEDGALLDNLDANLQVACAEIEKRFVLAKLATAPECRDLPSTREHIPRAPISTEFRDKWFEFLRPDGDLDTAIELSGKLQISEAIPYLRTLERTMKPWKEEKISSESLQRGDLVEHDNGVVDWRRMSVQTALRRIGECPWGTAARRLTAIGEPVVDADGSLKKNAYATVPYDAPVTFEQRTTRISSLKNGMSPRQVADLLGAPDDATRLRPADYSIEAHFGLSSNDVWVWEYDSSDVIIWKYDMDTDNPLTLVLTFELDEVNEVRKLTRIKEIRPPRWVEIPSTSKQME